AELQSWSAATGGDSWPLAWIAEQTEPVAGLGGILAWALAGVPVQPLKLGDRLLGCVFEDEHARYCRLTNLLPTDHSQTRAAQAREVLELMEAGLRAIGMDFRHVVRTWFYIRDILSWYDEFNRVRDQFFKERGVLTGVVPASTGVGVRGCGTPGVALQGGLIAVESRDGTVRTEAVPSPLQCPALDYGSSFSRAVELATPNHRSLFISGTASIAPEGETQHVGDVSAQIAYTLEVVRAILESRDMGWIDVTNAIGYFKHARDVPLWHKHCAGTPLAKIPIILTENDICRSELLFELELAAATTTTR
ncbi:MAG: RidA family protein, partial [Planctomycetota bacterium]